MINLLNYKKNVIFLFNVIAILNLINLILINNFQLTIFILFVLIYFSTLLLIKKINFPSQIELIDKNYLIFFILLLFSSLTTIFFSKYGYIENTLKFGLHYSRSFTVTSSGLHSLFSVFFYPLALLVVFFKKNRLTYINFIIVYITIFMDFYFSGARNATFFVIVFHTLLLINLNKKLNYIYAFCLFLLLITFFSFSTFDRSGTNLLFDDYFYQKIILSKVNARSVVNEDFVSVIYNYLPLVLPVIYFINYMGHGIFEFGNFIYEANVNLFIPKFIYIYDEFSLLLKYKSGFEEKLLSLNFNLGNYHTIYSSLLIDFGILIPFIFILLLSIKFTGFKILFLTILSLSFIENYFYNGIGLVRLILFLILYYIFHKYQFKFRA